MRFLFWLCTGLIGYVYVGYPALLGLLARSERKATHQSDITPRVTITISAYNEEKVIASRIENCLALDYPKDCLEILVGSDGSTDKTPEIARQYSDKGVKVLELSRRGKALTDSALIEEAKENIIITSSAKAHFPPNFLKNLVRSFSDPEVGAVTGYFRPGNVNASGTSASEGSYWAYDMWLREKESQLGLLALASGTCMGFRKKYFKPLDPGSDSDFMVPKYVLTAGKKIVFEPEAVAYDEAIETPDQHLRDRVRSITRSERDMFRVPELLNPLAHPGPAFSLWSHKILRWWTPFFAMAALMANLFLLRHRFHRITLALQTLFYLLAIVGLLVERSHKRPPRILATSANFFTFNLASMIGTLNALRGKRIEMWEPQQSGTDE